MKMHVKSSKEVFEADIVEQSSNQTDLDKHIADIEAASNSSITNQAQPKEATPSSQPSVDENAGGKDTTKKKEEQEHKRR
jgi:hypothetical protein